MNAIQDARDTETIVVELEAVKTCSAGSLPG
jgi:hypothetical protein